MATTIFERMKPPRAKKTPETSPEQKLLDWLQRWDKPIVAVRNIQNYVRALRDYRSAIDAAETLARAGWLVPVEGANRYNWRSARQWHVVRKPIVHPTIAAE
jgi:hypothetical protein